MTKSELNKFRNILETKQAELAQFVRNREGIAIEKSPDALDEVGKRRFVHRGRLRVCAQSHVWLCQQCFRVLR